MKILISSLTYPLPNGVSTSINTSVDGLLARGHQIRIISPDYGVGKSRPEHYPVSSSLLARAFLGLVGKKERVFGLGARGQIQKIADDFQPDIFWLHTLSFTKNAFEKVMLKSDKAKVMTYHTMVEQYARAYAGWLGAKVLINRSLKAANSMDVVITPSEMMAKILKGYGVTKPIHVIPTGIEMPSNPHTKAELAHRFHFPLDRPLLIHVGRLAREKNIDAVLRMAARLALHTDFTLLFVGPGNIKATLENAKQLGCADKIICTGSLTKEDARRCYDAADIFVFASQTETQGLVLNEAMFANTPVVALDSPIREEVYPDNVSVVIKNEDDFATEVARLINDPERRKILAQKAKKYAHEHFTIKLMIDREEKLFEDLVRAKG